MLTQRPAGEGPSGLRMESPWPMRAGFFWPAFPLVGWGIGLVFHTWDVYRQPFSEDQIRHEMERLR